MNHPSPSYYFLGSNSAKGFYSLYDGFCSYKEGCFLNVIKGGPGCGKSSFMRRIASAAEQRGFFVEHVLCSGDPDSLDGIYIPALGVGYVDGTAPHCIDPLFPGSSGAYLDLGKFYDSRALASHAEEIATLNFGYKGLYAAAYSYLSAAEAVHPRHYPRIWTEADRERIKKKVHSFAQREFKKEGRGNGSIRKMFLSAISCKGKISLRDTCCERLCVLDNELGMGNYYLEALLPLAQSKAYSLILCPDCLDTTRISALLIPELSLALYCSDALDDETSECYRHIRLDASADRENLAQLKSEIRRARKLSRKCLSFAADTLGKAKDMHDRLEDIYNPHVDFDGVYRKAENHIKSLFGGK